MHNLWAIYANISNFKGGTICTCFGFGEPLKKKKKGRKLLRQDTTAVQRALTWCDLRVSLWLSFAHPHTSTANGSM
jgi:hypothetical protein